MRQFEKLENEFSLECQKYGAESCAARFISMAACTYVFAVNQGKHPDEAMDISDKLFVGIMRGNKIKPEIMFNEKGNIKPIIVNEVAERTAFCKERERDTKRPGESCRWGWPHRCPL